MEREHGAAECDQAGVAGVWPGVAIQSGRGNHVCEGPESDIGRHIRQLLLCNE